MTTLARVIEILSSHINFADLGEKAEIEEYLEASAEPANEINDGEDEDL